MDSIKINIEKYDVIKQLHFVTIRRAFKTIDFIISTVCYKGQHNGKAIMTDS